MIEAQDDHAHVIAIERLLETVRGHAAAVHVAGVGGNQNRRLRLEAGCLSQKTVDHLRQRHRITGIKCARYCGQSDCAGQVLICHVALAFLPSLQSV